MYSALYNSGIEIVAMLLEHFPDYEIVFKPHVSDRNEKTLALIEKFSGQARFTVDVSGSNYKELYARTAVMVSDFSSTAYTFAVSTTQPVVFFSANEHLIPTDLRTGAYCAERTGVGLVDTTIEDIRRAVTVAVEKQSEFNEKIARFRSERIYNIGVSEEYLVRAIQGMVSGKPMPEWIEFQNRTPRI